MGLALLALLGFLSLRAPGFFAPGNLRDLLVSNAPVLVAAVGMTLVILARHIDISIGSQFAIGGVAAGLLAKAEIHRLMGDLAAQGLAILMISSELPEILGMSDRIAVLRGGELAGIVDRKGATQEGLLALALGRGQEAA